MFQVCDGQRQRIMIAITEILHRIFIFLQLGIGLK